MITFDFSNGTVVTAAIREFSTTAGVITFGSNPIAFQSAQTSVGLPGGTMGFTLSSVSAFYSMSVNQNGSGQIVLVDGDGSSPTGSFRTAVQATYTLVFDAGSGLDALSSVALAASLVGANILFATESGVQTTGFTGEIIGLVFVVSPGGTLILNSITGNLACFASGTAISTPEGEAPVEALAVGDKILTAQGETRAVKWVGTRRVDTRFGLPERLRPVRINAGALRAGVPGRDLVLTADHALLVDGMLVEARALVDGDAVRYLTPAEMGEGFTVYHIETDDHAVILADGAPAETFIDYAGRQQFDNYAEYVALYGEEVTLDEAAYPRVTRKTDAPKAA